MSSKLWNLLGTGLWFVAGISMLYLLITTVQKMSVPRVVTEEEKMNLEIVLDARNRSRIENMLPTSLTSGERVAIAHGVKEASERFDIPVGMILAFIEIESNFKIEAKGSSGEIGLMQIKPATGNEVNWAYKIPVPERGLRDPHFNIMIGCSYIDMLRTRYRPRFQDEADLWVAIALAYNKGMKGAISIDEPEKDPYIRKFKKVQSKIGGGKCSI